MNVAFKNFSQRQPDLSEVCLFQSGWLEKFVAAGVEVVELEAGVATVKLRYVLQSPIKLPKFFKVKPDDLYFKAELQKLQLIFGHPYFTHVTVTADRELLVPGAYISLPEGRIRRVVAVSGGKQRKEYVKVQLEEPTSDEQMLIYRGQIESLPTYLMWNDYKDGGK